MEAPHSYREFENWQLAQQGECVIVNAAFPDRPVTGTYGAVPIDLMASFHQVCFEFFCRLLRENLMQANAQAIHLLIPQLPEFTYIGRVSRHIAYLPRLKIYKHLIFRNRTGHQLAV